MSDWWLEFFDDAFPAFYDGDAEADAAAIAARLGLVPGDRVLDQCCGFGRLSLALAARGLEVTGIDINRPYVERARADAARAGLTVDLAVADAFEHVADPRCAAVVNWATSFGYADDARNLRMLERARASLEPGGRFLLDYPNVARVLSAFAPTMVDRRGDTLRIRESSLDLARGTLDQVWTYVRGDGERVTRRGSTRLYLPAELASLLRRAGFDEVELTGDVTGAPLDVASPRCVCVARVAS